MISITKNQIPEYLKNSEFYNALESNEPFEIEEQFYSQELVIDSFDKLLHYIKICDFWLVNKTPTEIYRSIFENRGISLVVASPFSRCVQTAAFVCYILGIPKLTLLDGLGEVHHPKVLKKPIAEAQLRSLSDLELPEGIEIDGNHTIGKKAEEIRGINGSADDRFRAEILKIAQDAARNGRHVVLVVTHGDCLASCVAMTEPPKSVYQTDYCACVCLEFNFITNQITIVAENNHGVGIMDN